MDTLTTQLIRCEKQLDKFLQSEAEVSVSTEWERENQGIRFQIGAGMDEEYYKYHDTTIHHVYLQVNDILEYELCLQFGVTTYTCNTIDPKLKEALKYSYEQWKQSGGTTKHKYEVVNLMNKMSIWFAWNQESDTLTPIKVWHALDSKNGIENPLDKHNAFKVRTSSWFSRLIEQWKNALKTSKPTQYGDYYIFNVTQTGSESSLATTIHFNINDALHESYHLQILGSPETSYNSNYIDKITRQKGIVDEDNLKRIMYQDVYH